MHNQGHDELGFYEFIEAYHGIPSLHVRDHGNVDVQSRVNQLQWELDCNSYPLHPVNQDYVNLMKPMRIAGNRKFQESLCPKHKKSKNITKIKNKKSQKV